VLTGLTDYLPEMFLSWGDNLEFFLRIVLSAVFGILIGLERSKRQKDAGIRTHCIIAISSAAFMILSKYAFSDVIAMSGVKISDPARLAAQVVSGISFLGAGVIFKDRNESIKGLTTAAGMWATAAVGMSIGAGMYWLGVFTTLTVVMVQTVLHRFPVGGDAKANQDIFICITDTEEMREVVQGFVKEHHAAVEQSEICRKENSLSMKLTVRCREPITNEDALDLISRYPGVLQISI